MLRTGLLWLSEQPRLFSIIRGNGLARRLASRFVAGETVEAAVAALTHLNAAGIRASLDLLGESVAGAGEARAARDTYLETLDRIRRAGADANVSVKLTQMGLTIDERLCVQNLRAIIATHDTAIIAHAKDFARQRGVAPQRFEFQMLYGVRRDLQRRLRREGYNVRVYVPFGSHWYPYLMRRLAERPANVVFLLGNIVKESLRRS